ncbi:hypothetical protein C1645_736799, partial [Glomus cerebriforme]
MNKNIFNLVTENKPDEPYFIHETIIPESLNITTKISLPEEAKPKDIKCLKCKTICSDITEFNKHAKSKHNLVHLCKICSIVLNSKQEKNDHLEKNHEKEYDCKFCIKKFWQQKDLNHHIKMVHYDIKTDTLRVNDISYDLLKKINSSSLKLKEEFFIHDIVEEEIKFFIKTEKKKEKKETEQIEEKEQPEEKLEEKEKMQEESTAEVAITTTRALTPPME